VAIAPLFEAVERPLDDVAAFAGLCVEGVRAASGLTAPRPVGELVGALVVEHGKGCSPRLHTDR
jgi:hypothetical protein